MSVQMLDPQARMSFDLNTGLFLKRTGLALAGALLALGLLLGLAVSQDPTLGRQPLPLPWDTPLVHFHAAPPPALPATYRV